MLQMLSEPDTGRCASLLAVLRRGVDTRRCASKDAGPRRGGGWIMMSHIGWGGENTIYKGRFVPTFSLFPEGGRQETGGRCASKDVEPRRGVDCDVPHWLGRRTNTIYKGTETFP